jgi:gentisate 1,2-dioxygenase
MRSDIRKAFADETGAFLDVTGQKPGDNQPWAPIKITKEEIDAEIERLAEAPAPADGRRASLLVHPKALSSAPAMLPGVEVTLSVLKPGEKTEPFRHNATEVNFCIRGSGHTTTAGRRIEFSRYDVWNNPSYAPYWRANDGDDLQVCLTYTNAPLLKYMQVYIWEADPPLIRMAETAEEEEGAAKDNPRRKSPYGTFEINDDGAKLMPYELLINPPAVESKALFWPWKRVRAELKKLEDLGSDYVGRRLYLLYNPVTGRTNGTTPNFFATITVRPPKIVDRPHRHVSGAINYYFHGTGRSSVGGRVYEWKAGDIMLSAPGWVVHNHASHDDYVYELTIQDQPLNIVMESLLWQENMKVEPALLGTEVGFDTNRKRVGR